MPAVNLGCSGKSIDSCIASLRYLLSLQLLRLELIVVANIVNTSMGFVQVELLLQPGDFQAFDALVAAASEMLVLTIHMRSIFPRILYGALKPKLASGPYL